MPHLDLTKPPTRQEFDSYLKFLDDTWANALASMRQADGFYYRTNNIWEEYYRRNPGVPQNRMNYHSGMPTAIIDNFVNAHLSFEPRFTRFPVGPGEEHGAKSGRLESGLQAVVSNAFTKAPNFPTKENGKQIGLYNYTIAGVLLDEEGLQKPAKRRGEDKEDFEEREFSWNARHQTWNPIKIVVPSPGEVLMDPLEVMPKVAIRRLTMKAFELEALTQGKKDRGRDANVFHMGHRDPYEDVKVEEWWSAGWVQLREAGGRVLFTEKNRSLFQPWAHIFGGDAISPVGTAFDLKWWIEQAMIFRAMDTITMFEQTTVGNHGLIIRAAFARMGFTGNTAEGAEQQASGILQGEKDDWWVETYPDLPAQSFSHKEQLEAIIERVTVPRLTAGLREPQPETATGILILSENADNATEANVAKTEHLYSIVGSNILQLVFRMDAVLGKARDEAGTVTQAFSSIGIGEHSLNVQDMEGKFHIVAKFERVNAAVAIQEAQTVGAELEKGWIDWETYLKVRRYEDPEGMRKGIYKDAVYRDPAVFEQGVITAMREAKFAEIADRRQAELDQQMLQRTLVGPDGRPLVGEDGQGVGSAGQTTPVGRNGAQ